MTNGYRHSGWRTVIVGVVLLAIPVGLILAVRQGWLTLEWSLGVAAGTVAVAAGYKKTRAGVIAFFNDLFGFLGISKPEPPDQLISDAEHRDLKHLREMERKGQLSAEAAAVLRQLEEDLTNAVVAHLRARSAEQGTPETPAEEEITAAAVAETVKKGSPDEVQAMELLAANDIRGGLDALEQAAFAADAENADRWRRSGVIAYRVDTVRALKAYKRALTLDGSDSGDAIYVARLYRRLGSLEKARETLSALERKDNQLDDQMRYVLLNEMGDVHFAQGDHAEALESYRAGMAIAQRLADTNPSDTQWQRNLSVSHNKVGDVLMAQGDDGGALESYRAGLKIAQRLAETDPSNMGWQRDLSVSHNKVGDVLMAQGDDGGKG